MPLRMRFPVVFSLLIILLGGGCATAGKTSSGGRVAVHVNNNLALPTPLTVYVAAQNGGRRLIGNVSARSRATLRFDPVGSSSSYRLVGKTLSGAEVVSTPFFLGSTDGAVRWDLQSGIAVVVDDDG